MALFLTLLLACSGSATIPAVEAPAVGAAAVGAAAVEEPLVGSAPTVDPSAQTPVSSGEGTIAGEPTVGQGYVIRIEPDLLEYDAAAGTARFSPDSRRQSAHYTEFLLDTASLEAVTGGRPSEAVWVVVDLSGVESRTVVPEDPTMPAPSGGFQYTTWTGTVRALSTDH